METALSIESFSPTQVELANLVTNAEDAITKWNPEDELSVELFKSRKKDLQQARLQIKEVGKSMREEALRFQKQVIAHEKTLLDTIEPVEDRMKTILDEQKQKEIRAERMAEMPERKKMLAEAGCVVVTQEELQEVEPGTASTTITVDELLSLDHDQFVAFLNKKKADQLDRMLLEQHAREAEARRAEEIKQAEERARAEAEARKEREAKEATERAQKEADERLDAERRAREDAERKLAEAEARKEREVAEEAARVQKEAEDARRAKEDRQEQEAKRKADEEQNEAYQGWLHGNGFSEETAGKFLLKVDGATRRLYSFVDSFEFK